MAATVTVETPGTDIRKDAETIRFRGDRVVSVERTVHVTFTFTGEFRPSLAPQAITALATTDAWTINSVANQTFKPWSRHPVYANCRVVDYRPEDIGRPDGLLIHVLYESDEPTFRAGTYLEGIRTDLKPRWNWGGGGALFNSLGSLKYKGREQAIVLDIQAPRGTLVVERLEPGPNVVGDSFDVAEVIRKRVGTVNDSDWRGGIAKTWLCTNIFVDEPFPNIAYRVSYEFAYKPETWVWQARFIGEDGLPLRLGTPTAGDDDIFEEGDYYQPIDFIGTFGF